MSGSHTQTVMKFPISSLMPSCKLSSIKVAFEYGPNSLYAKPFNCVNLLCHRFKFHSTHWRSNSNWKLLYFKKCKEEPVGIFSFKGSTKWDSVRSHHNQALMWEDSGVITRSYHSFITLQRDTPTISSLLYPLSCYSPLWSFLLSLTLILYLSLYHFTTQL